MPTKNKVEQLQAGRPGSIELSVVSSKDYPVFSAIIQPGDTIQMKIRVKQEGNRSSRNKKAMQFAQATLTVEAVEAAGDGFSFTATYSSELGAGRSRCWLTDGETLVLSKARWTREQLQALTTLHNANSSSESPIDAAANFAMEQKAMAKVEQLTATNWDLLTYGRDFVFCALDAGAVECLILTETLLKDQTKAQQNEIGSPSRKFRGAGVIVVQVGSPNYERISQYGGALAILRYPFDPALCL